MRRQTEQDERAVYEWMLVRRLLHEAGQLPAADTTMMDARFTGWRMPITAGDLGCARDTDDPELRDALRSWRKLNGRR